MYKGSNNGRLSEQKMESQNSGSWQIVNPTDLPSKCPNLLLDQPSKDSLHYKAQESLNIMIENSTLRSCKKNTKLLNGSGDSDFLYYITSGTVQLSMVSMKNIDEDSIVVLSYLTKGNFFGEMGLCIENGNLGLFADAKSDVTVAKISYDRFKALCEDHPNLKTLILNQITSSLVCTRQRLIDTVSMQVIAKTRHVLRELECHEKTTVHDNKYDVNLSRKELATIVGCSREMVYRSLVALEKEGIVQMHGAFHKVTVMKEKVSSENYL